jgi:hypothetical protein
MTTEIKFDDTWVNKVICEAPYVKLLAIPKFNETEGRWEALAQVNEMLCIIEVTVRPTE